MWSCPSISFLWQYSVMGEATTRALFCECFGISAYQTISCSVFETPDEDNNNNNHSVNTELQMKC